MTDDNTGQIGSSCSAGSFSVEKASILSLIFSKIFWIELDIRRLLLMDFDSLAKRGFSSTLVLGPFGCWIGKCLNFSIRIETVAFESEFSEIFTGIFSFSSTFSTSVLDWFFGRFLMGMGGGWFLTTRSENRLISGFLLGSFSRSPGAREVVFLQRSHKYVFWSRLIF